jgi:hypothetical protein
MANPLSYIGTHHNQVFLSNPLLIIGGLIGISLSFKRYKQIVLLLICSIILLLLYLLGIKFLFGDMIQFALPFFVSFFIAAFLNRVKFKKIGYTIVFLILLFCAIQIYNYQVSISASISDQDYYKLLELRRSFDDNENTIVVLDADIYAAWISLISKDSKILYPFSYEGEDMDVFFNNYILNEQKGIDSYQFVYIRRRNNLVLENDTIDYGFKIFNS